TEGAPFLAFFATSGNPDSLPQFPPPVISTGAQRSQRSGETCGTSASSSKEQGSRNHLPRSHVLSGGISRVKNGSRMKETTFLLPAVLVAALLTTSFAYSQAAPSDSLFKTIQTLDTQLFDAYNHCD